MGCLQSKIVPATYRALKVICVVPADVPDKTDYERRVNAILHASPTHIDQYAENAKRRRNSFLLSSIEVDRLTYRSADMIHAFDKLGK